VLLKRPGYLGIEHPGPIVFGEVLMLVGIGGIGQGKGVAAPSVEGIPEVYYLGPFLPSMAAPLVILPWANNFLTFQSMATFKAFSMARVP